MRILMILAITMAEVAALVTLARSQQGSPTGVQKGAVSAKRSVATHEEPLVLTEAIPLENAKGRFDHFAMGGGKLFVAALGSNAVEVINIGGRILDHTITGIPDPQGIAFAPETNKLFSGRGKVYIYDGKFYDQSRRLISKGVPITYATMWRPDVSMLVAATIKRLERSP